MNGNSRLAPVWGCDRVKSQEASQLQYGQQCDNKFTFAIQWYPPLTCVVCEQLRSAHSRLFTETSGST